MSSRHSMYSIWVLALIFVAGPGVIELPGADAGCADARRYGRALMIIAIGEFVLFCNEFYLLQKMVFLLESEI